MDSWTLQGDSYSFLRSAPRTFSLCHRDGTPNHVEIFDIINTPSQRSAISETTCLCDIFGDDGEAPSLSSSPASAAFTPPQTEVEGRAATSPLVDDLNDSSGSYHTAHSSSEGEEGLEDPSEKQNCPELQSLGQEQSPPDLPGTSSATQHNISPVPQERVGSSTSEEHITVCEEKFPSLEHKTPQTPSPEGLCQSLSSSLVDIRHSPSPSNSREAFSETGTRSTTPASRQDRHSSLSHHTPSPEPRNCASSSSSPSVTTQPEIRGVPPVPESICDQNTSPSPELQSNHLFTPSTFKPKVIVSSTDIQPTSPCSELRGRILVPDLFSRHSTPDLEDHPQTSELISSVESAKEDPAVAANKDTGLPVEIIATVSTPGPQYTSPSPINSLASSPEPTRQSFSSDSRLITPSPSPSRLSPISPANTTTRSPTLVLSSQEKYITTPSESRTSLYSPVVTCSLSPSPGCSPVVCIDKATSPEVRITASSPELENKLESPVPEPHSDLPEDLPSSPHITRISYSVVQPEDRFSPAFPKESCLSTLEITSGSPKSRDCSPSRDSPHSSLLFELTEQQPEARHKTPSPETRNQSSLSQHCQSLLPHHSSRNLSPASPTLEQPSPAKPSADYNFESTFTYTPEEQKDFSSVVITEGEDSAKPLSPFKLESEDSKVVVTEIKSDSPVAPSHSPQSIAFSATKETAETTEVTNTKKEPKSSVELGSDYCFDRQDTDPNFTEVKADFKNSFTEVNNPVSDPILHVHNKHHKIVPAHEENTISPIKDFSNPQPHFTNYSQSPKSNHTSNTNRTPKPFRRELSGTVGPENKSVLKENMASHVKKRRTPSPPLTRFTPVHIIAPEKPYRQWQTRGRSPPQGKTSLPSANLKKVVTNTEIPHHDLVNNSQDDWFRNGRQLEMERALQLQVERAIDQVQLRDCGMYTERKREERVPDKGEGWHGDASYREEQVELSFNAKNRKGPVSRSTAPTSRDTRPGLPTAHSCSESLLTTRQSKQQQTLLRLSSQHDSKSGGPGRRLQPPIPQHKSGAPGRVATNRPGRSSSSSMGSELDEADHEVKWFTDVAFSSLSSPEVDYLDMYNSSHRSSTNISQPSTQESPAGVNTPWLSYADFRGSAQMLDSDELALHQSSAYYSDGLDPSRCYELGSFECVDVAVEKEDSRRVRRGVPKRQIQLKRRDTTESKQDDSSENSSPGVPVMDNFCQETHTRETLIRQHSTPPSLQGSEPYEKSPEPDKQHHATKSKLQKSSSFDESCSKTKIATCLIKSVLTKKMQNDELAGDEETCGFDENIPSTKIITVPSNKSPKPDVQMLSSSLQSDCSLSSDMLGGRSEPKEIGRQKNFGGKFSNRPSSTHSNRSVTFSQADSEEAEAQTRNAAALQSEFKVRFDSTLSSDEVQHDNSQTWKETEHDDSANNTAGSIGSATGAGVIYTGHGSMTNREQECENTQSHEQAQQGVQTPYKSKSPNSLPISSLEKKKASLNVCLTPEAESKSFTSNEKVETVEACVDNKIEEEQVDDKVKEPLHKVRDVRRLVKNTYNLSFKATSAAIPLDETDDILNREQTQRENSGELPQEESKVEQEVRHKETLEFEEETTEKQKMEKKEPKSPLLQQNKKTISHSQPMHIEYKAVCWKDDNNKLSQIAKDLKNVDDKPLPITEENSQNVYNSNTKDDTNVDVQRKCKVSVSSEKQSASQQTTTQLPKASDNDDKPMVGRTDRPMLGSLPKMPSKEREVSTAVVLIRDNTSRTKRSTSPTHEDLPITVPASSPSPGLSSTPGSSGHSVSMLLKEKGYQADIGAVVGDTQNAGGKSKSAPSKHVNCLEIPLQTTTESHRERTFSSSSTTSGTTAAMSGNTETNAKIGEEESAINKPESTNKNLPLKTTEEQTLPASKQGAQGDFEAVKRLDPTFPPRSPAIRRFKPQPIEVKSMSKEMNKHDTTTSGSGNSRPQAIEVKSIAKNSQKPIVPPKPSCKFKPLDLGAMPNETQRQPPMATKPHTEDRTQTIVVSSPTIYRKIPNDSTSNYTRKVAVSSVSSLKPPPSKPVANCNVSAQPSETEPPTDRLQRQQPGASSQSTRFTQRHPTLPPAPVTTSGPTISLSTLSDATEHQPQAPGPTGATQTSQAAVTDLHNQLPHLRMAYPHEPATIGTSNNAQPAPVSTTQAPGYIHKPYRRSLSNECSQRRDDLHFYASDDPPSYDDRESFSPLRLPDLPPRSNRYQPTSRAPPCSCTAGCPSHPGPTHPHNSPHNLTPPAPTHSPGQAIHYPVTQPSLRAHHCRPDPQPVTYQPSSPKSSPLGPGPPQGLYQPLHQPPPCPPHPSLMHAYPTERPMQPGQHIDSRRPPVHRSPQQPPAVMAGAPYTDPAHSHSPGLPHIDPHYLCGPQSLGPSYGSEYGGDSSSLYSETNYGQTPRRVLMDPETGKYFYIEVPVQPLRKMLFDPETGQYVEVLIPQQAMSHSSLYPPSAPNYPSIHNTNMYAPAAQYMPYAAPPAQPQPPRYPEVSAAAPMHPHGPGVAYRNPSGQGSKTETQGHPPVDPNYLEGMYYVPTGMNASPNPTPPDYYHKHPPNLPPTGGKRS